ncbi:hypothetical protein N3K63_10735 [Microbacterium sp. W1N]|uniref:hypothetical protein n=1 Tax=Microbacterium festucae TaxID=2977531 RepID=UPI0021BE8AA7|nr:hypothetical protein [Microbacterium festucae]MCT9820758.1 hypothetical protein [Microbacterium festucae]
MTTTSRILTLAATAALAFGLSACSGSAAPAGSATTTPSPTTAASVVTDAACTDDEGVTLVVDASALEGGEKTEHCLATSDAVTAGDAFTTAGFETEGTTEYGDQVVCRVDGLPSATEPVGSTEDPAYVEACEAMPAAFAYWSLWVKPAGGDWDYAQEGLATQQVAPGDSVELLFTLDGAPAAP